MRKIIYNFLYTVQQMYRISLCIFNSFYLTSTSFLEYPTLFSDSDISQPLFTSLIDLHGNHFLCLFGKRLHNFNAITSVEP